MLSQTVSYFNYTTDEYESSGCCGLMFFAMICYYPRDEAASESGCKV
jgi:hypothetical protein